MEQREITHISSEVLSDTSNELKPPTLAERFHNLELKIVADSATYEALGLPTTSQTVEPVILADYYGTIASVNNPVTATGASSGQSITATISSSGAANVYAAVATGSGNAFAPTSTLYRTKLTTAWATDNPSGASSPSSAQTVAKFVVTNLANSGSYVSTVNLVNLQFSTTISAAAGSTASQALIIYKDSLSTTALATTYWTYTGASTGAPYVISGTSILTDANFTDVDVSSGASKTFLVTLDTSASVSTKTLSLRINSGGITWTDGVTASLTVMSQDLPLSFKTFSY